MRARIVVGRCDLWAVVALALLSLLYWKVRIIDLGVNERPSFYSGDLHNYFYPMTEYAFSAARAGRIPLWNPYQLFGQPFLATGLHGLFYPLRVPFLFLDAALGIEVDLILHMLLGAIAMWCLLRHFGVGTLGASCSALTFVWSGWLIYNVNQPPIYDSLVWMPLVVLLFDLVAKGQMWAGAALSLAIGCQMLLSLHEVVLHTLYAAGLFAATCLARTAWRGQWRLALRRGLMLVISVLAGVLLVAVQLFPAVELARGSTRAAGSLTFEQVSLVAMPLLKFVQGSLEIPRFLQVEAVVTVGALPVLAALLCLGYRKHRLLWICALGTAVIGLLLASGGPLFRLYYALPVGGLFRRPVKFMDLYTFGQAVLVGVAVSRLESWITLPRRQLWRHPAWLGALALGGGAQLWAIAHVVHPSPFLPVLLALLVLFAAFEYTRWRRAVLVTVCALQAASLFFATGTYDLRPWRERHIFREYDDVWASLRDLAGYDRAYVFCGAVPFPRKGKTTWGMRPKQARNRVFLANDSEPMNPGAYGRFFDYLAPRLHDAPFLGGYVLNGKARWRLMDLTGTRYFLAHRGGLGDAFFSLSTNFPGAPKFRLIRDDGFVRLYERPDGVLPRTYVVPKARIIPDPQEVLETLDDARFDPWTEVILSKQPKNATAPPRHPGMSQASIVRYDSERVGIAVTTDTPGFLVLSDLYYPGWKAFIDDREVPIYRANYLFRAIQVDAGSWFVRFEYHPASFCIGLLVTLTTAIAIILALVWPLRRATALSTQRKRPADPMGLSGARCLQQIESRQLDELYAAGE